jgi:hypothetical protein
MKMFFCPTEADIVVEDDDNTIHILAITAVLMM